MEFDKDKKTENLVIYHVLDTNVLIKLIFHVYLNHLNNDTLSSFPFKDGHEQVICAHIANQVSTTQTWYVSWRRRGGMSRFKSIGAMSSLPTLPLLSVVLKLSSFSSAVFKGYMYVIDSLAAVNPDRSRTANARMYSTS